MVTIMENRKRARVELVNSPSIQPTANDCLQGVATSNNSKTIGGQATPPSNCCPIVQRPAKHWVAIPLSSNLCTPLLVRFKKENSAQNRSKESNTTINIVPEDNAKEIIHCLKYDNLDSEEFQKMWQSCSKYRIHQILQESSSLTQIFQTWPQYKGSQGPKLICIDFDVLQSNYVPIYDWETMVIKLYTLIAAGSYIKDPKIKGVLKNMDLTNAVSNMSLFTMKVMWCLHGYLFPTSKFIRNDKEGKISYGKYTMKDSQDSCIFLAQNMQEIENHLCFLTKRKENIQPFILAVGADNFESDNFEYFMYLDGTLLPFNDFERALDTCFKSFHLFNLEFPKASFQFWIFIQIFFYNIKTPEAKTFSKVLNLQNDLKDRI